MHVPRPNVRNLACQVAIIGGITLISLTSNMYSPKEEVQMESVIRVQSSKTGEPMQDMLIVL